MMFWNVWMGFFRGEKKGKGYLTGFLLCSVLFCFALLCSIDCFSILILFLSCHFFFFVDDDIESTIIYVTTVRETESISSDLRRYGITALPYNGQVGFSFRSQTKKKPKKNVQKIGSTL